MAAINQSPEQKARDNIDAMLNEAGWKVQDNKKVNFNAGLGIAVREFQTDIGPADYALFVDGRAVGIIEAKPEDWGHKITTGEEQSGSYATAQQNGSRTKNRCHSYMRARAWLHGSRTAEIPGHARVRSSISIAPRRFRKG